MIVKQYRDVILGRKWETRRMADRYTVGKVYAVVPKMYKSTIYYRQITNHFEIWHETYSTSTPIPLECDRHLWIPLRVRVTAKRQEPLLAITENGAIAEGIWWSKASESYVCSYLPDQWFETAISGYRTLWDNINTKKGTRWQDNPVVNVITFEVVK